MIGPRPVQPTGPQPARLMCIGEGPGKDEIQRGYVFCGPSGKSLDANLWRLGLRRDDVRVRNMVLTGLPGVDPSAEAIQRDLPDLLLDISVTEPEVIVTLGRVSTRHFLGDVDMDTVHGIPHRVNLGRDFPAIAVVPAFHPAAGLWNPDVAALCFDDLKQAKLVLDGKLQVRERRDEYPEPQYRLLKDSIPATGRTLAIDTEGTPKAPYSLQFSDRPGMGCVILATNRRLIAEFAKRVKQADRILIHNAMYDIPMLRAMGIELDTSKLVDTMVMAYLLRLEPQGLKPLASRHCSMEMHSYDDVTGPWDRKMVMKYLRPIAKVKWPKPDEVLERDPTTGREKIRQPQPLHTRVLAILGDAEADPRKRWLKIDPTTRAAAEARFGPLPDFNFSMMPEEEFVYYACRDTDATIRVYPHLGAKLKLMGLEDLLRMKMDIIPISERMQAIGMPGDRKRFEALGEYLKAGIGKLQRAMNRANGGLYLNPGSGDQVAEFLFNKLKLPPGKLTKSRKRYSTNDKVLEMLRHRHPSVELVINHRELSKTNDSFVETLPEWMGPDSRIRPTVRITRTNSGRLSMTSPNLQAIPVRSEDGRKVRGCFVAPGGRLLGSCDLDQIEMRVMADESRDPELLRLFRSGKDIHAETASRMFGIPVEKVDPMKHRYPAKRVGFGVITGITGMGLVDQMFLAGIFDYDESACDQMIRDWFKIYSGVRLYMDSCRSECKRNGYVKDRWGMPRFLPGAWSPIPRVREEALRQTHSHKIQGGAQGLIQRAEARIWKKRLPEIWKRNYYCEALLQIHDELLTEHDQNIDTFVGSMLVGEMTAESKSFAVPILAKFKSAQDWGLLK